MISWLSTNWLAINWSKNARLQGEQRRTNPAANGESLSGSLEVSPLPKGLPMRDFNLQSGRMSVAALQCNYNAGPKFCRDLASRIPFQGISFHSATLRNVKGYVDDSKPHSACSHAYKAVDQPEPALPLPSRMQRILLRSAISVLHA